MTMELRWLMSSGSAPSMLIVRCTKYIPLELNLDT